eukprot:scaffold6888_cov198-Pinguiococcus_pyrenoidosus.AAC.2
MRVCLDEVGSNRHFVPKTFKLSNSPAAARSHSYWAPSSLSLPSSPPPPPRSAHQPCSACHSDAPSRRHEERRCERRRKLFDAAFGAKTHQTATRNQMGKKAGISVIVPRTKTEMSPLRLS